MRKILFSALLLFLLGVGELAAELRLPHFFSDHMVLQREVAAAVWGTAEPGAKVTVAFKGAGASARADEQGRWRVGIPTGPADADGATLIVRAGTDTVQIRDVLVGEVWLASGQSNMYFTMNRVPAYEELLGRSDHPGLRMFNAPLVTAVTPQDDIAGEWRLCSPDTAPGFSAVAFFFARRLHLDLGVPVGVLKTAWGGKPVETFTSREALNTLPGTRALVEAQLAADRVYDPEQALAAYEVRLLQWEKADKAWRAKPAEKRGRRPRAPAKPKRPLDTEGKPGVLFNSMIHPFVGYSLRGAIWYQGEGNAKAGAVPYDQTLPLMIRDWRHRWRDDFSFYFVQLANFREPSPEPGNNDPWPLLQDRMRRVLATTPRTGMAIINDIGEARDIHPKNKHDVGERLARWALAKDYGRDLIWSGPLFRSSEVASGAVLVRFEQAGKGLKSRGGGPLARFEIAGPDRVWHWAEATIVGRDTVRVSSARVKAPVAVRYAWAANPEGANLVNSDGLPASVFRTDDWPDVEAAADDAAARAQEARRALAAEIKALAARRAELERGSPEFKAVTEKHQALMKQFRAGAPAARSKAPK